MTWTQFFMYLGIVYLVYYALVIMIDVLKGRSVATTSAGESEEILTFSENIETITLEDDEELATGKPVHADDDMSVGIVEQIKISNEQDVSSLEGVLPQAEDQVTHYGGTTMQGLLKLAREGALEYTRNVAY